MRDGVWSVEGVTILILVIPLTCSVLFFIALV